VSMTTLHSKEDYLKSLINQALNWQREGKTCAIIFPTAAECQSLYDKYGKNAGLTLVTDSDKKFKTGSVIIPSYMAKGLEFDAVALPYNSFSGDELKHLFYTAATRALHVLKLFKY
ncbi:MAG: ATP-binding domain-containing protein, partial [Clostridia bacterium]|nr:ATP-binding domain-containing protein [Clostridia bacterium]